MILPARSRVASRVALAATAALAASAVLATAGPASAEIKKFSDGKNDTWTYSEQGAVKDTSFPEADLTKVTFDHRAKKVVVKANVVNLRKSGDGGGMSVELTTPADTDYYVSVFAGPGSWKGAPALWGYDENGGADVKCKVGRTMDYADDRITLSVPTSCIEKPQWIKTSIYQYWGKDGTYVQDNPANKKDLMESTGKISRG